jgi:hypothetical protein
VKNKNRSAEERTKLLEAGWESTLRGGLITWRRSGGRGSRRQACEAAGTHVRRGVETPEEAGVA